MNTKKINTMSRKSRKILKKTSLSENNNINKNNKTSDDVTPEKEYDATIKKVFAESMSGELLIVI